MGKICVCDIDGIVCNRDARLALARSVYLAKCDQEGKEPEPQVYNKGFDWETFLNPENLYLDTLIGGIEQAIHALLDQGWHLVYLTSRPEHMRLATLHWLNNQTIAYQPVNGSLEWIQVYMKDEENRYTKTPKWKSSVVQNLVEMYQASEILIVDDQTSNLQAIAQVLTVPFQLHTSLADAIEASQDKAMRWLAGER